MRILVTFAVEQEFAPWRKRHAFRRTESGVLPMYEARIGDADVTVAMTGIGLGHAIRAARGLLASKPDACISAGLAGGLRPEHHTGKVLTARALRMAEDKFIVKTDARLRRVAAVCGARVVDLFYSSERVITTAREKAALGMLADAVEMESYAIVTEAARVRVPAAAVRAIGDSATVDLPIDFNRTIGERGQVSIRKLLGQMASRPAVLPSLIRMGAESRRAAESLAQFLDNYVAMLAERRDEPQMSFHAAVGL
jgi:nucleoside phosphorylase